MPNQSDPNQNSSAPQAIPTVADLPPMPPAFQEPELNKPPTPSGTPTQGSAAPQEIAPMISTPKKKFGGGRIIATILGILLLVGGVGAGLILTQQRQVFEQKAGSCVDVDCAITLNQDGKYHYDESKDQHKDEDLDGNGQQDNTDLNYLNTVIQPVGSATDNNCTGDGLCPTGSSCINNACVSTSLACKIGDPNAPGCCANLSEADCAATGDVVCENGPVGARKECRIGGVGGQHCTLSVGSSTECGGANPTEPPGSTPSVSCLNVKAYDSSWVSLSEAQLSELAPSTVVNFCVGGTASEGNFDQAEFKIGEAAKTSTTTPRPGSTNEFCQSYTIKATDTTVSVKARIHHVTLGWTGETI